MLRYYYYYYFSPDPKNQILIKIICLNFIRLYLLMAINDLIIIIIIIINEMSLNYLYKKIQKFIIRKIYNNNNTICIVILLLLLTLSKSITVKCKREKSCKSLISVTTKAAKCCCVSFTGKAARFHADHAFTLLVQNTGLRKQYQDRIGGNVYSQIQLMHTSSL